MIKYFLLLCALVFSVNSYGQGLKTKGKAIVDASDKEVLLRGMGLGGWALMEGYMMQAADVANTQHEFRSRLVDLMGEENTNTFFEQWRANHCTKEDIDSLAAWGFNSVRLPMHYNLFTLPIEEEPIPGEHTWFETGFDMIDSLLSWCKPHDMYVILDLHAAPGGQGYDQAISDYDPSKPSLWESKANRDKTVALWQRIANRYKNEEWIGGYDLINEPNWELPGGTLLRELYGEITDVIRAEGDEHIIFIEGNWFANDYTGLTPPWDDNMVYSFHKYWSYNNENDLDWVLPKREQYNVPLWMGESGENSNVWFNDAVTLFENNNIGWAWWTMKKIETTTSPFNVPMNQGYKDVLDYWRGEGPKPTVDDSFAGMMKLANNLLIQNSAHLPDVPDALIRQVETDETIPYSKQDIPGIVFMSDFDLGKQDFAYYDVSEANYQLSSGQFTAWNGGWTYRNDAVDIEKNDDVINSNGYHVGFVEKGEWINYTVNISDTGIYKLSARVASEIEDGQFHLALDGQDVTSSQSVTATGGWTDFVTLVIDDIILPAGKHVLTFHIDNEKAFNIGSIEFELTGPIQDAAFVVLNGETTENEKFIEITLNHPIDAQSVAGSENSFSVTVNGDNWIIDEVKPDPTHDRVLGLILPNSLKYSDVVMVSYSGTSILSTSSKPLASFTNMSVINNLPARLAIPGKIQAEDYFYQEGFQTETTTDTGGGLNLGYTNVGDYADYLIFVDSEGQYKVNLRLAAEAIEGNLGFYIVENNVEIELFTVKTPVTGGWQKWVTQSTSVVLPQGSHVLRIKVLKTEFNLNWFEFTSIVTGFGAVLPGVESTSIFPNPSKDKIYISDANYDQYRIFSLDGIHALNGAISASQAINVEQLDSGLYVIYLVNSRSGAIVRDKILISD